MKATNFMIGDWVYYRNKKIPVQIFAVEHASKDLYNFYTIFGSVLESNFDPIPLTPEILEKNGFKEYKPNDFCLFKPIFFNPKEYRDSDDCIRVFFTSKGFCFRSGSNLSIALKNGTAINKIPCYVHQLQHALRLCGIEKEIVL